MVIQTKTSWGKYQKFKKDIADSIFDIIRIIKKQSCENKKLLSGGEFIVRNSFNKKEYDNFGEKYYPKYLCLFIISGVLADISPSLYISQRKRSPVYQISIFCKDESYTGFIHSIFCEYIVEYYRKHKKINSIITDMNHNEYVEGHQSYCAKINIKFNLNF